jgi:hypothetical protein
MGPDNHPGQTAHGPENHGARTGPQGSRATRARLVELGPGTRHAQPAGDPGLDSRRPAWVWRTKVAFSQASGMVVAST